MKGGLVYTFPFLLASIADRSLYIGPGGAIWLADRPDNSVGGVAVGWGQAAEREEGMARGRKTSPNCSTFLVMLCDAEREEGMDRNG